MHPNRGEVAKGVIIALTLGAGTALIMITSGELIGGLALVGAVQLLYVLPIIWFYRRRGETETVKGVIIITGIILLLNAACDGILYRSFRR